MKTYRVYGLFTGTKFLGKFEAETEEEAIEKGLASDNNQISLCHQCSGELGLDDYSAHTGQAEIVE